MPADAYGPTTIGSITYASADASQTTPLGNARVIVGPVPIVGATAPPSLPAGDVATTTTASGAFRVTLGVAPAAPSLTAEPFAVPAVNLSGYTPPATGYYVQVFGSGTDGATAGMPLPLHRFFAANNALALRVTSPTVAEANALVVINSDRAANGAGPVTFDESAEETARQHAADEVNADYYCHYDTHNVGPASRYLAAGGLGQTSEALGLPGSTVTTPAYAFQVGETQILAEKTLVPPGGHFRTLVGKNALWIGLSASAFADTDKRYPGGFYSLDYELIDPGNGAVTAYPVTSDCLSSIVLLNS